MVRMASEEEGVETAVFVGFDARFVLVDVGIDAAKSDAERRPARRPGRDSRRR